MAWYESRRLYVKVRDRRIVDRIEKEGLQFFLEDVNRGGKDFDLAGLGAKLGSDFPSPDSKSELAWELLQAISSDQVCRGWNNSSSKAYKLRKRTFAARGIDIHPDKRSEKQLREFKERGLDPEKVFHGTTVFKEAWEHAARSDISYRVIASYKPGHVEKAIADPKSKQENSLYRLKGSSFKKALKYLLILDYDLD